MIMISEKLNDAINEQITAEMWSSNLYLSMSFYLAKEGLEGLATWMRKQSQEELEHAYDLADYVAKRGGAAKVTRIDEVPQEWNGVVEVFENVYSHECHVSKLIDALVDVASSVNDKASQDFLWGYVREQVEEESTAQGILEKLKKCKDYSGIMYLDDKLGQRK